MTTNKKQENFFIAEFYKTEEEQEVRKNQIKQDMQEALKAIKAGKIYADIRSVSRSGMSRRIAFYYVKNNRIVRATSQIAWLSGSVQPGRYYQGNKELIEHGLQVHGCGMDMIFHTLYNCMPYDQAKNWTQYYNRL